MICPKCRKKILFEVSSEPLPRFDFISNKWFHEKCWVKMQLRKKTAKEQEAIAKRQKILADWRTF